MKTASSRSELMQRYVSEFEAETGKATYSTRELAVWAIRTSRWEAPSDVVVRKCQQDFAQALRTEFIQGDNGQPVRRRLAARSRGESGEQSLWGDIQTAPDRHIQVSLAQYREQIAGECRNLKSVADYIKTRRPSFRDYQLILDFTDDVEEGEQSTDYGGAANR